MKHLLLITIAALVLLGCATTQQPEPPTVKAPDISIHKATYEGNIEAVKQHLAAGTDVNTKALGEYTPLHYAVGEGHKEIAELLIEKGADVDAKNEAEVTSLHYAAIGGHKETTELLIAKGADVNAKDDNGDTALDLFIQYRFTELADLLRKHGGKTGEELKAEGK